MTPNYKHIIDLCRDDKAWQLKKLEKTVRENEPELVLRIESNILAIEEIISYAKNKMRDDRN